MNAYLAPGERRRWRNMAHCDTVAGAVGCGGKRERCLAHPSAVSHHVTRRAPSSTSFIQTWRGGSTFSWHRQSWVTPSPRVRWRWRHTGHSQTRLRSYFNRSNGPFMAPLRWRGGDWHSGNVTRSPYPIAIFTFSALTAMRAVGMDGSPVIQLIILPSPRLDMAHARPGLLGWRRRQGRSRKQARPPRRRAGRPRRESVQQDAAEEFPSF